MRRVSVAPSTGSLRSLELGRAARCGERPMRGLSRASLAEVEEHFNAVAGRRTSARWPTSFSRSPTCSTMSTGSAATCPTPPARRPRRRKSYGACWRARSAAALEHGCRGRVAPSGRVPATWPTRSSVSASSPRRPRPRRRASSTRSRTSCSGSGASSPPNLELHRTLTDPSVSAERKRELLAGSARRQGRPHHACAWSRRSSVHPRGRSLEEVWRSSASWSPPQRQRLVAVVRSAVELSEEQKQRLATWLRTSYGRDVHLNVEVDPRVIGGFSVHIGDDIIDTTIAGRIEEVRRRLAG